MVRFVVGPDGVVVPDLAGRLPGRGLWLSAERDMVNIASRKNLFAKAARRKVTVPQDLADTLEGLIVRRCAEMLGLARRSGQLVAGFEKTVAWLRAGKARKGAVLLAASDGGGDGRAKLRALAPDLAVFDGLTAEEIGQALGRDHAVRGAVAAGSLADRLLVEQARLKGFRRSPAPPETSATPDAASAEDTRREE